MEDSATNHALTEVALALAMAFFAIMILAMVSMSMPSEPMKAAQTEPLGQSATLLASAEKQTDQSTGAAEHTYLFFFDDRYYDQQLQSVDLATLPIGGKVVLALPPSLTVDKAMAVQAQVNHPDLVITQLNAQWLQRLETL